MLNANLIDVLEYHENKIKIKQHLKLQEKSSEFFELGFGKYKVDIEKRTLKFSRAAEPNRELSLAEKFVVAKETLEILKSRGISKPVAVAASGPAMVGGR